MGGAKKGFTLVEIIVSFAILALVSAALIAGVMGIIGMQARDNQLRSDGSDVESRIANEDEADETTEGLSLPLGDYTIDSSADTYNSGIGSYTVINPGESSDPETFELDGDEHNTAEYTVERTGFYKLEVWGASGGGSGTLQQGYYYGGSGGYSVGIIELTEDEVLYLQAGGQGTGTSVGGGNGYPDGGGAGYDTYWNRVRVPGGGGGSSDIRVKDNNTLNRILVAGGGGGAGSYTEFSETSDWGGHGGGTQGVRGHGTGYITGSTEYGFGGTQQAGGRAGNANALDGKQYSTAGTFGQGGSCTSPGSVWGSANRTGGGGGGGWFGGGAGTFDGGGGGSGFVLTQNPSYIHPGYFSEYKDYYFVEGTYKLVSGDAPMPDPRNEGMNMTGMRGNGFVRITWVGPTL